MQVEWAGLKSAARAVDKILLHYGGDVSKLTDVCRETIVFDRIEVRGSEAEGSGRGVSER